MSKSVPLAKNKAFVAALEQALGERSKKGIADDAAADVWMFFKTLTLLEGGDCQNLHQIAVTAASFFDRHLSASAPAVKTSPEAERILSQFSEQELRTIEQVATSKPQRRARRNKSLQAGMVTVLSLGSIGFGAWRQAEHNRAAVTAAAEQTAAYRAEHPDDPITISPQFESLCPAPYILGGLGLLCAASLLMVAHEIGQAMKKTDAQSQADYGMIIEKAFDRAETRMREEGHNRGGRG